MKYKQVIKNGLIKKFLENNFEIRSEAALRIFKSCGQCVQHNFQEIYCQRHGTMCEIIKVYQLQTASNEAILAKHKNRKNQKLCPTRKRDFSMNLETLNKCFILISCCNIIGCTSQETNRVPLFIEKEKGIRIKEAQQLTGSLAQAGVQTRMIQSR